MCCFDVAISVNFSQSLYTNDESTRVTQPILLLSNPSSIDIAVQIQSINISAYGKHGQNPMSIT